MSNGKRRVHESIGSTRWVQKVRGRERGRYMNGKRKRLKGEGMGAEW